MSEDSYHVPFTYSPNNLGQLYSDLDKNSAVTPGPLLNGPDPGPPDPGELQLAPVVDFRSGDSGDTTDTTDTGDTTDNGDTGDTSGTDTSNATGGTTGTGNSEG